MSANFYQPRQFHGVTISSTFTDLSDHRQALIKAIRSQEMTPIAMENDGAKLMDVIDSSLKMVRDGAVYVGVIGLKYGQVPPCPRRNPDNLSITELEFNEARKLGRPILLFIMDEDHLVRKKDIEADEVKKKKLDAFRQQAKEVEKGSGLHRVYAVFKSLEDFKEQVSKSIRGIQEHLDELTNAKESVPIPQAIPEPVITTLVTIPRPPALYAAPSYIGSHKFVGRQSQLEALNDWCRKADPNPVLLFDAIGGSGKSMLTWEWTINHAAKAREDWAGIFWYSFYERGAIMADFCRHALAYITGWPLEVFSKKRTPELKVLLLYHLKTMPWLLILDGLERVLVAYHRFDAAEIRDEELDKPTDRIVSRDPCSCIYDEDEDLLRLFSVATPSKILISSRLVPRVLFNAANQAIPGVFRTPLPGLRPADAEALFRACEIRGNSETIQNYLTTNCDCHPLTIGVLAGIVNDYLPDKGNFDAWLNDANLGSGQLNLAELNLVQKRNHILKAGIEALSAKSRQLLSTLAVLSEAVDYNTLSAFNPYIPTEPEDVVEPNKPEEYLGWAKFSEQQKTNLRKEYELKLKKWENYQETMTAWRQSTEYRNAPVELGKTVHDLERRGLLQYDHHTKRYDLHPVVRGVAAGSLQNQEKEQYGQRVVDYFSSQPHKPYDQTETLDDLRNDLHVMRTLLKMGRFEEAFDVYNGDLGNALLFNLEAYKESLMLISPFFPDGWSTLPIGLDSNKGSLLANSAAIALDCSGEFKTGLSVYGILILNAMETSNLSRLRLRLRNASGNLTDQCRLAASKRIRELSLSMAIFSDDQEDLFLDRLYLYKNFSMMGELKAAEDMWHLLDPMGREWLRSIYRPGSAEFSFALHQFRKGELKEEQLLQVEQLAVKGKNRTVIRNLHWLRGMWYKERSNWELAAESFGKSLSMARAVGQEDANSETWLILSKFRLGQLTEPIAEAERLTNTRYISYWALAELWLSIDCHDKAKSYALKAYKLAWADGEPYVHRYELNKVVELLKRLGEPIPDLPPYDPAKDEKLPWEEKVEAFIERLKAEKEKKSQKN